MKRLALLALLGVLPGTVSAEPLEEAELAIRADSEKYAQLQPAQPPQPDQLKDAPNEELKKASDLDRPAFKRDNVLTQRELIIGIAVVVLILVLI